MTAVLKRRMSLMDFGGPKDAFAPSSGLKASFAPLTPGCGVAGGVRVIGEARVSVSAEAWVNPVSVRFDWFARSGRAVKARTRAGPEPEVECRSGRLGSIDPQARLKPAPAPALGTSPAPSVPRYYNSLASGVVRPFPAGQDFFRAKSGPASTDAGRDDESTQGERRKLPAAACLSPPRGRPCRRGLRTPGAWRRRRPRRIRTACRSPGAGRAARSPGSSPRRCPARRWSAPAA